MGVTPPLPRRVARLFPLDGTSEDSRERSHNEPTTEMSSNERLAALGETYSADILAATATAASAKELSEALDIPIATCYRRIECLVEAGLLEEEGREFSNRGRRTSVYRRTVDGIAIEFDAGEPTVRLTERSDPRNVLGDSRSNVER